MLLSDMFDRVLAESGEYILDPTDIEVDTPKFARLVRSVLGTYSKYRPVTYKFNLINPSLSKYTFTTEFTNPLTGDLLGIPDWVSDATPLLANNIVNPFFPWGAMTGTRNINPDLVDKTPVPFIYRKPHLFFPFPGSFDCTLQYNHKVTGSDDTAEVISIDENSDVFFDLLQAKFLISLGRNRRAFTLQALDLTTDASELVSEGKQQWTDAKEDLIENNSQFYLAWG